MLQTLEYITRSNIVIMSYHFATRLEEELRGIPWDLVVLDEAHKLRNAHRPSNRIDKIRRALEGRKAIVDRHAAAKLAHGALWVVYSD